MEFRGQYTYLAVSRTNHSAVASDWICSGTGKTIPYAVYRLPPAIYVNCLRSAEPGSALGPMADTPGSFPRRPQVATARAICVTCVAHGPSAVVLDDGGDQIEVFAKPAVGGVFVFAGKARVACHIRVQDGGELSRESIRVLHGGDPLGFATASASEILQPEHREIAAARAASK